MKYEQIKQQKNEEIRKAREDSIIAEKEHQKNYKFKADVKTDVMLKNKVHEEEEKINEEKKKMVDKK